jgi:hypothetical protein
LEDVMKRKLCFFGLFGTFFVFVLVGCREQATPEPTAKAARLGLTRSAELGLGTNDPANMDLVEVNLG